MGNANSAYREYRPAFSITPELLRLLTAAAELRVWIGQAAVDVAWLPALQRDTAQRLAHSSTSIEGNPLTLPEVEALARGEEIGAAAKAKHEVLNYLAAMRWIWGKRPGETGGNAGGIVESDLLKLHKLLTQKTIADEQSGHYKPRPNRVVDHMGRTIYTPPGPKDARPLTRALLAWVNSAEAGRLSSVVVNAIAHHRLVSIHPFADGNGRTARALGVWLLYTRGYDTHHLFALDEFYQQDRRRYYDKIQQVRDLDDDLTGWLEYVAEGTVETLKMTRNRIASLQVAAKTPKIILTRRQEDFLRFMRDSGRVKSPDLEKAFGLTRSRVAQVIKPLVVAGLIAREGRTRATTYRMA